MHRYLVQPIRHLLTAFLALSVSVCCCHAHIVVDELSVAATDTGGCGSGSCCSQSAPDETPEKPAAPGSCKGCCVKGTGLKDAPAKVPALELVAIPDVAGEPAFTAPPAVAVDHHIQSQLLRVEPTTLVRLRCALIV